MQLELFVSALHIVLCILMVLIILLQPGKGGDIGAAFGGGGGGAVFGPRGSAGLLARATTVVAVMFMVTSLLLSKHSGRTDTQVTDRAAEQDLLRRELDGPDADPTAEEETGPIEEQAE